MAMVVAASAATPAAQSADPAQPAVAQQRVEILSRYSFHLTAERLASDDDRFVWDTNFGGELDLVDYGGGRATFVANYQAILGNEFRRFDPNQGNYILAGSMSARLEPVEVAAFFHHESRHLSDRFKRPPVDWNMAGARVLMNQTRGRVSLEEHVGIGGAVQKSFVDYRWEFTGDAGARAPVAPRLALIASGGVRVLGVDGSQDRGTQTGFRAEGGVRIEGPAAAAELFLAGERRIDPYPLEFGQDTWLSVGFRLVSR
jgi:hypothetical protein